MQRAAFPSRFPGPAFSPAEGCAVPTAPFPSPPSRFPFVSGVPSGKLPRESRAFAWRFRVFSPLKSSVSRFFLLRTKRISSLGKSSLRKRKSPGIRPGPSDGRTSGVSLPRDRPRRVPRSTFPFPGAGSGKSGSIGDAGCGSLSSFPSPPQTPWIGQSPGSFPRRRPKKP